MFFNIEAGDIYKQETMGGGGFGNPLERDPARVRKDVTDELLSVEKAREDYGVVINPDTIEVDPIATKDLRSERRKVK